MWERDTTLLTTSGSNQPQVVDFDTIKAAIKECQGLGKAAIRIRVGSTLLREIQRIGSAAGALGPVDSLTMVPLVEDRTLAPDAYKVEYAS